MFSFLIWLFFIIWVSLLFLGGSVFSILGGHIEVGSIEPWILLWGILCFIQSKLSKFGHRHESVLILRKIFENHILNPKSNRNLILGLTGMGLLFGIAHSFRFMSFHVHAYDLTFIHQSITNYFYKSKPLVCGICLGESYFGEHLSFTLFALAPFLDLIGGKPIIRDILFFFFESALVVFSLFLLIKHGPTQSKKSTWTYAFVLLVCSKALRNASIWDFREDHIAFALLVGALTLFYQKQYFWFVFTSFLASFTKENIPIICACMTFPIFFDRSINLSNLKRYTLCFILFFGNIIYLVIAFKYLIPHFNSGTESVNNIVVRFAQYGSTPLEILNKIVFSPNIWIELIQISLFNIESLKYLFFMFIPFVLFFRQKPIWLIPALPGICMNLFSNANTQRSSEFHYDLIILPFIFFSALHGVEKATKRTLWAGFLIALVFSGRWPGFVVFQNIPSRSQLIDLKFFADIPKDKIIATSLLPMAYLSHVHELRQLTPLKIYEVGGFNAVNQKDRTHIPGHSALQAEWIILDSQDAEFDTTSKWISNPKDAKSWMKLADSPSGRFQIYEWRL